MTSRTTQAGDAFGHVAHPWIGKTVYDIANGQTGVLTAVVDQPPGFVTGAPRVARLAYVRSAKNVEWSTVLGNLSLASAT